MTGKSRRTTTGHVFIATSLDGFVARKDHQLDWLMKQDTQGGDQGYGEFTKDVDGLVFGRGTYQKVLGLDEWPYEKPVVVLSGGLSQGDVPASLTGRVEISALGPVELMKRLAEDGWSRAYIDGGKVVQAFVRLGLVEDIILTTVPILIGDGIRPADIDLELLGSKTLDSGLVQSHYRLASSRPPAPAPPPHE